MIYVQIIVGTWGTLVINVNKINNIHYFNTQVHLPGTFQKSAKNVLILQ